MINKQYESKGSGFIDCGQELPINGEFYEVRYLSDLTEKATEHFEIAMCVGSLFMTIEPDHLTNLASKTRLLDKFITHFRHIPKCGTLVPHSETVQSGFSEIVENIIRDVAELPDRTSPEDWPDAMLVTADELDEILQRHLNINQETEDGNPYPFIIKAAQEIWYDNGMVNRLEPESEKLEFLNIWLKKLDQNHLANIEKILSNLTEEELDTLCCGEETEAEKLAPTEVHEFLDQIFDREYEPKLSQPLSELPADVVLPDSPEAATEITVTAWQSRKGLIYLDQNIARWDGSTHRLCKRDHLTPKHGYCEICVPLDNQEEYATYPTQKWNGEILYSMANDEWFFDKESVLNALKESGKSAQELMLVLTEPTLAQEIDPDDYYESDLPDGINVPDEIATAFDALNEAIKNCNTPLCYYPSKIAAIIDIDMDAVK